MALMLANGINVAWMTLMQLDFAAVFYGFSLVLPYPSFSSAKPIDFVLSAVGKTLPLS